MNADQRIRKLIKSTIQRAIRESVAGLLVISAFTFLLQHSVAGSGQYYGCLLVLVSSAFVLGVIWSYTLSYHLLGTHPASDTAFWREAFVAQARLLRLVPLWYLAPLSSGILLMLASARAPFGIAEFRIAILAGLFAFVTWVNRSAALKLENSAATLA